MVTRKRTEKDFLYYLNLPWTFTIEQELTKNNKKHFIIYVNELPGVCTDATSLPKAFQEIKEAMLLAFEMYLDAGEDIPVPEDESKSAEDIVYRTSSRRYSYISQEAKKRHLSLSRLIDTYIDAAIEHKK